MNKNKIVLYIVITIMLFINNNYIIHALDSSANIYWHVFFEDKNKPIKNVKVYTQYNDEITGEAITNKEWFYNFIINDSYDYINICADWLYNSQKLHDCQTISVYNNVWRTINWIDYRDKEYDFFFNWDWVNLNDLYEEEISNSKMEEEFSTYEIIERQNDIKLEKERIEEEERELAKKFQVQYKLPPSTELKWNLEEINIKWTVTSWDKDIILKNNTVSITFIDHFSNDLWTFYLNDNWTFQAKVKPKEWWMFKHPINMQISSNQKDITTKENIFNQQLRLIYSNQNIFNIVLEKKESIDESNIIVKRKHLPILEIILIIIIFITYSYLEVRNKKNILKYDY